MGKVLIQVGQSEEARVAAESAAASGAPAPQLVLPRSNVPEDIKPVEEAPAASASEEASSDAKAAEPAHEVCIGAVAPANRSFTDMGDDRKMAQVSSW